MRCYCCVDLGAFTFAFYRKSADWSSHPIVKTLKLYDADWRRVAASIDAEYRRIDKFCVALGGSILGTGVRSVLLIISVGGLGIRRVVVTDSWVMLVSSYGLYLSQQSDVDLRAIRADEHNVITVCFAFHRS